MTPSSAASPPRGRAPAANARHRSPSCSPVPPPASTGPPCRRRGFPPGRGCGLPPRSAGPHPPSDRSARCSSRRNCRCRTQCWYAVHRRCRQPPRAAAQPSPRSSPWTPRPERPRSTASHPGRWRPDTARVQAKVPGHRSWRPQPACRGTGNRPRRVAMPAATAWPATSRPARRSSGRCPPPRCIRAAREPRPPPGSRRCRSAARPRPCRAARPPRRAAACRSCPHRRRSAGSCASPWRRRPAREDPPQPSARTDRWACHPWAARPPRPASLRCGRAVAPTVRAGCPCIPGGDRRRTPAARSDSGREDRPRPCPLRYVRSPSGSDRCRRRPPWIRRSRAP